MNDDLISREALKKALSDKDLITWTHEYGDAIPLEWIMSTIDNAPTVSEITKEKLSIAYDQGYKDGRDNWLQEEPKGDLISRSYLKNLPFERVIHTDWGETAIPIEEIDNAPTVEPKQGEWAERSNRYDSYLHRMVFKCECNQCQMCEEFPQDDETGNILLSHYCPNCGADMWKGGAE